MDEVNISNLLQATSGEAYGIAGVCPAFRSVSLDSRTVRPGDLFWAIAGERHDGHEFAFDAYRRGAVACVVRSGYGCEVPYPQIRVSDTRQALADFSQWYRQQHDALLIGVTGSVGKTTTREMIYSVLQTEFSGFRSPRNFNNQLGVPLTLLEMEAGHDFGVLEIGASAVGEIAELANIVQPEIGVVTAIAPAHLEGFGGLGGVIEAKGELLAALPAGGFAVLPGDDPVLRGLADRAACQVVFVGEEEHNDIRATEVKSVNQRLTFRVDQTNYEVPVLGRHHLSAALIAVAVGKEVGLAPMSIQQGLQQFRPIGGRCQVHQIGPWTVIDDCYNANPRSMEAACRLIDEWPGFGKKYLVLGEMVELGPQSEQYHWELGKTIAPCEVDRLLLYGAHCHHVSRGAREHGFAAHNIAESVDNLDTLLLILDCWLEPGDVLLVKGSRAMQMERVIDWLRQQAVPPEQSQEYSDCRLTRAVA